MLFTISHTDGIRDKLTGNNIESTTKFCVALCAVTFPWGVTVLYFLLHWGGAWTIILTHKQISYYYLYTYIRLGGVD